ncbi:MAG: hypothetical protein SO121_00975 [Eggerthellaceae bacterium]|nr:hypothetical protein [Eggerthellaceae bacterium]
MSLGKLPDEPKMDELIEWLNQVLEVERRIYVIEAAIKHGNDVVRQLSAPIKVVEVLPETKSANLETASLATANLVNRDEADKRASETFLFILKITYIIGYLVWVVDGFMTSALWGIGMLVIGLGWPLLSFGFLITGLLPALSDGVSVSVSDWIVVVPLLGFVVGFIAYCVSGGKINKANKAELKRVGKANEAELARVKRANEAEMARVTEANKKARIEATSINNARKIEAEKQMAKKRQAASKIRSELNLLNDVCDALKKCRNELYQVGYLHPSYQSLASVVTILHLLETRRCITLQGPHGAIDTLECDNNVKQLKNAIDRGFEQVNNSINRGFEQVVGRLDAVTGQLGGMNRSLGTIESLLEQSNREVRNLNGAIDSVRYDMAEFNSSVSNQLSGQSEDLKRIKACEEYRTQTLEYLNGQRRNLPPRV